MADGLHNFEFIYIGGLRVMISFLASKLAKEYLEKKASLKNIFKSLEIWDGQDIPFERVAGIRIHGVPLEIRDESTFNKIAMSFGKILRESEFSWNNAIASYGFVYILVNHGSFISEKIKLDWKGRLYEVWVQEEWEQWIPIFPEEENSVQEEMDDNESVDDADGNLMNNMGDDVLQENQGELLPESFAPVGRIDGDEGCIDNREDIISSNVPETHREHQEVCMRNQGHEVCMQNHEKEVTSFIFKAQSNVPQSYLAHNEVSGLAGNNNRASTHIPSNSIASNNSLDLNITIEDTFERRRKKRFPKPMAFIKQQEKESRAALIRREGRIWEARSKSIGSGSDDLIDGGQKVLDESGEGVVNSNALNDSHAEKECEIDNTIRLGNEVGFQMDNFRAQVSALVNGDECCEFVIAENRWTERLNVSTPRAIISICNTSLTRNGEGREMPPDITELWVVGFIEWWNSRVVPTANLIYGRKLPI
ncbi:hypothetical protein E3N88_38216 [Mikania micrantha]|uniref:DUF4283 domain-containing protein n=1 Tax=Mikania micrantha TaxID=192012 RepID=A0A5N6LTF7_9ASTR|nr:hypothetical protein E3N88_38216 [Mikania micrantha]